MSSALDLISGYLEGDSMAKLTSHVLDIAGGTPAVGMRIRLKTETRTLADVRTNGDGRCTEPLLEGDLLVAGRYTLVFHVAEYFRARSVGLSDPPFLDEVVIEFGVADPEQNYHVPLLVTPWSYSTYRGS
jgi:5-hydroxyisourate hydrolase